MNERTLTVALVAVVVASVMVPFVAPIAAASSGANSGGMVNVPSENIDSDLPPNTPMGDVAERLQGEVLASENASTLEVTVTNPGRAKKYTDGAVLGGGPVAIVLSDDENHAGRKVALPADVLRDVLGYVPDRAYGTHESGEQWTATTTVEDGSVIFEVPHFSTNTVTFAGQFQAQGTYTNGSQVQYNLTDLDSASDVTVNLTGVVNGEWDNESFSGVGPSEPVSFGVGGDRHPTGPANGEPRLTLTSASAEVSQWDGTTDNGYFGAAGDYEAGDGTIAKSEFRIENPPDTITALNFTAVKRMDPNIVADIYITEQEPDQQVGDGTLVKSGWNSSEDGRSFDIQNYSPSGDTVIIEFDTVSAPGGNTLQFILGQTIDSQTWASYEYANSGWHTASAVAGGLTVVGPTTESVTVEADDGTTATVAPGESVPFNVSTSASSLSYTAQNTTKATFDLDLRERTGTSDAGVELNGNSKTHFGTLAEGNSTQLTISKSALEQGTNVLNVSVGDGTLTADAPTPQVVLNYTHEAATEKSVSYEASKWTEAYNISHTYASARSPATMTIPFDGDVISIRNVEKRVDGGSWQTVPESEYSLNGTTMEVELGSIPENTTVEVRTSGSKVNPQDLSLQVLEPTDPGQRLNSKVEVTSVASNGDPQIGLPNTRVTYAYNESWSATDSVVFDSGDSQTLHIPNVGVGSTFRASTIPVTVDTASGDVRITVTSPTTTEPEFIVDPGPGGVDTDVTYTFLDAKSGEDYSLYSKTEEIVRAQGTANSPISLSDDDSEETLVFLLEESDSTTDDCLLSDSCTGPIAPTDSSGSSSPWNSIPAIIIAFAAIEIALFYVDRRIGSPGSTDVTVPVVGWSLSIPGGLLFWAGTATTVVMALEFASGGAVWGAIAAGVQRTLNEQGEFLAVIGAVIVAYYAYKKISSDSGPDLTIQAMRRGGK